MPLHAVAVPGHVFVRHDGTGEQINIETLSAGALRTDRQYRERFKLSAADPHHDLPPLTDDALLGLLHYNLGNLYRATGKLAEAHRHFTQATELHPQYAPAWANRALLHHQAGDNAQACRDWQRARELDPTMPGVWRGWTVSMLKLGRLQEAEIELRTALSHRSALPEQHVAHAMVLHALGRNAEAMAACRRALQLEGNRSDARSLLTDIRRSDSAVR
jgi:tetratricopeptide (TPR) repeat protein